MNATAKHHIAQVFTLLQAYNVPDEITEAITKHMIEACSSILKEHIEKALGEPLI